LHQERAAFSEQPVIVNFGEAPKTVDIKELEEKYTIRNRPLFYKCIFILGAVIVLFFLNSLVSTHLSLAWIALIGTISLLILSDVKDINVVLEKARRPFTCYVYPHMGINWIIHFLRLNWAHSYFSLVSSY